MVTRVTLRQLEYFVAVGEEGSIALAAERVNVSSPSISAAITQLEAEFGLQLFVRRHAHGLSLTQGGQRFIERARTVLAEVRALDDLANDISGRVGGPLNVGCLLTFAQIVLPRLRRSFIDRYPDVEVHQFERDQQEIIDGLRSAKLDIALSYDMNIPPDIDFLPLMDLPPFALLPEDHPLAGHRQVTPADLAPYPMVLLDLPISSEYFLSFFDGQGLVPHVTERTRDIAVLRSLVANGFGYGMLNVMPRTDLAPDGRRLRLVPLSGHVRTLCLGLMMTEGAQGSRTIRAFIEHAKAEITAEKLPGLQVR